MDDLIAYYSSQNERLELALYSDCLIDRDTRKKCEQRRWREMADTEEKANARILTSSIDGVQKRCSIYLERTHNPLYDDIQLLFGNDGHPGSLLHRIHSQLNEYTEQSSGETLDVFTRTCHVVNLNFDHQCVRCSEVSTWYKSNVMKKFLNYKRSYYSKKAVLSFSTYYKGIGIQVVLTSPCPSCTLSMSRSKD